MAPYMNQTSRSFLYLSCFPQPIDHGMDTQHDKFQDLAGSHKTNLHYIISCSRKQWLPPLMSQQTYDDVKWWII